MPLRPPNAELVNDRVKLLLHRVIACRLRHEPSLIEEARQTLARQRQRGDRECYGEWEALLRLDLPTLRQEIVRRDERMTRLRLSSPLHSVIDIQNVELRRRIWRAARRTIFGAGRAARTPGE